MYVLAYPAVQTVTHFADEETEPGLIQGHAAGTLGARCPVSLPRLLVTGL